MQVERLDEAGVAATVARLRDARHALSCVPLEERVAALGRLAEAWCADDAALRETAEATAGATGYAVDMVEVCLRRTLRAWSTGPLRALVHRALARPGSHATAPDLVLVVLAQNTPGLALAPAFSALALGAAVLLKTASAETSFAPRLANRLRREHDALGRACEAVTWPGGDRLEEALFPEAGRLVAYGAAPVLARARALAGERVVARGPRVSLAVVGDQATAAQLDGIAKALARDVAFLDQRGCLSPQAVFVSENVDRTALGRALARALDEHEAIWPRRRLSSGEARAFREAAERDEARSLGGRDVELLGGTSARWAVVIDDRTELEASPLDRFIRLHPYANERALARALDPVRHHLECVGLAGSTPALERVCQEAGFSRLTRIGDMQDPPADWHAGGSAPLEELLIWSRSELTPEESTDERRADFLRHVAQTSDAPRGIDVDYAQGSWVYDRGGNRHLDLLAGIGVASIGHAHPRVAAAVSEQSRRYTHVMVYGEDILAPQVALARRLASRLPDSLSTAYLTNSGAEAIEGALKLVRKATGRSQVLAFEGAYHGDTTGAMALGGNPFYREPFRPLLDPIEHLPWNDEAALTRIDERTAAVFVEPVQAEAGVRLPDATFLPALARRCREVGALLVFDEVVTGLGRTGRWFGFEQWPGSVPDVIVLAKSLGGGLPLGAFAASSSLQATLAEDPPLGHVTTFGGNPVCCAAGLAALDVLAEESLPERAGAVGARFRDEVAGWVGRGGLVDVRGIGLLLGLEFETPAQTASFADACRARGLLLGWTLHQDCVIRLAPPLNIRDDELALATRVFDDVLRA